MGTQLEKFGLKIVRAAVDMLIVSWVDQALELAQLPFINPT